MYQCNGISYVGSSRPQEIFLISQPKHVINTHNTILLAHESICLLWHITAENGFCFIIKRGLHYSKY